MEDNNTITIESLASKCRKTIANNIDRYQAEFFGSLPEMEWEEIVRVKYQLTAPKVQVQKRIGSNLLSDGRKFPVFTVKFIAEIEQKNQHLQRSKIVDELVWRDCVDFKFKKGGPSRPLLFREPWDLQVERLKSIMEEIQQLSICNEDDERYKASVTTFNKTVNQIIKDLQKTAMIVPLLSASGIGKGIKKLIKKLRGVQGTTQFTTDLEKLLQNWKEIASAQGVAISKPSNSQDKKKASSPTEPLQISVDGKSRHTSDEQHAQDIRIIQTCSQWRDLFEALSAREKKLFKSHGEKMRKIRQTLEVGRPKISTAKTKNKKMLKSTGGLSPANGLNQTRKLGKLRQEFNDRNAMMKGGRARLSKNTASPAPIKSSSFGSSVSTAMNVKKKTPSKNSIPGKGPWKRTREVVLPDGKKMKMPKYSKHMNAGRRI